MATNFRLMTNVRAEALPTASSASALDSLLNEYRTLATSEREKGTMFEELTRQFLLHDARFARQFKVAVDSTSEVVGYAMTGRSRAAMAGFLPAGQAG